MVNNKEEAKMSKFYFKRVVGAYSMSRDNTPDFLETKVLQQVSYATIPGFGPGYVNTSAEIVRHYSAKITRKLTDEEEKQLGYFLIGNTKFDDRAAMALDAKLAKATAKEFIRREEAAWKRQGRA